MKKQLLTVALAAALVAPISVNADDSAITEKWKTPQLADFVGSWGGATTNWANRNEVMAKSDTRFATAKDGKIYTVNQKTQCIAEVTTEGLKDVYELKQPALSTDYYGVGISIDEAGNFLLDMDFTARPASSLKWAVYSPTENALKEFELEVPQGWNIGRIDCIGRVLGDLTKEAYFYIVPETNYTSKVRVIKATGNGTVASISLSDYAAVDVSGNYTQQNIAQPAYQTLASAKAAGGEGDFYYSSCNSTNRYYAVYEGGTLTSDFAPDMKYTTFASSNGFDTFELNGKRYFVRNYATTAVTTMDIVVMNENGDALAIWSNPEFVPNGGYSTIIAEPLADNTANIYVFNCTNSDGAAAMLNFDPSKAGAAVKPAIPEGSIDNPHKISTSDDLVNWGSKMVKGDNYFEFENDIDMSGVAYEAPLVGEKWSGVYVHIDGKNHVIRNLTIGSSASASLLGVFMGELRNLGLVDVNINSTSWGGGAFAAIAGHSSYSGTTVIDNCFSTGVVSTSGYSGGIAGYNFNGKLEITNCYTNASVSAPSGYAGGILGQHPGGTTVIENVYASGAVSGSIAGGIVSGNAGSLTLNNSIAWNTAITASTAGAVSAGAVTVNGENNYTWDEMLINGSAVTGGKTTSELQSIATAWTAFNNKLNDGYPVLAWQEANGAGDVIIYGTKENPYQITNADELLAMGGKVSGETYFTIENDIDMSGVAFNPINVTAGNKVYLDGKQHVISNLVYRASAAVNVGLFATFAGEISNLGLENVEFYTSWGCAGAFIGSVNGTTAITDCFSTGSVSAAAVGGLIGTNNGGATTITNCYSSAIIQDINNHYAGGLVGRADKDLVIENSYASGSVSGPGKSGGIASINSSTSVTLNNVVAWNSVVTGAVASEYVANGAAVLNNVEAWSDMSVNGVAVSNGKSTQELQTLVTGWEAFNDKLNDGYPVLAWQEANGEGEVIIYGSEEHPYVISTAEDLANLSKVITLTEFYVELENDIDMSGVAFSPISTSSIVHLDGKEHVISNLAISGSGNVGMFSVFQGTIANLGLENVVVTAGGWDPAGAFAAYAHTASFTNCFTTGSVTGYYAGGIIGGIDAGYNVEITDCYSTVAVTSTTGFAGGLIACINYSKSDVSDTATITNSFASGTVKGKTMAGGIVGGNQQTAHDSASPNSVEKVILNNVVVLNPEIDATTAGAFVAISQEYPVELTTNNVYVFDETTINGVGVADAKSKDELVSTITGWDAFAKNSNGEPVLKWQTSGITDGLFEGIVDENADEHAVYYNLQGVQVINPANGIYIVKRGNKVSKEYIR